MKITASYSFIGSHDHRVAGHARPRHAHAMRVSATVSGSLDTDGVVLPFEELERVLVQAVGGDVVDLNELCSTPSVEKVALGLALAVRRALPDIRDGLILESLRLEETDLQRSAEWTRP